MKPEELAEFIIDEFAIRDPKDIDLEAISIDSGMLVRYENIDGCAAALIGVKDKAIATIRPSGNRGRDRFSTAHELGHWKMHRGQSFYCRAEDFGNYPLADKEKEREADTFASHLLMPTSLLKPVIGKLRALSARDLEAIAGAFSTSVTAMAFRITLLDNFPVMLCCYSARGREWFRRAPMVSARWRLKATLDKDSFAYDFIRGSSAVACSGKQSAEVWFENSDADRYEIREECIPYRQGQVLVLLYLSDQMLEAIKNRDDWYANRR